MKIVFTADSRLPGLEGQEIGAFRLAKYLRRKGRSVKILATEKHPWNGPEKGGHQVIRTPRSFGTDHRRLLNRLLDSLFRDPDGVHYSRYCRRLAAHSTPLASPGPSTDSRPPPGPGKGRADRGGRAQYRLDHFDWNILADRILEVYRG